MSADTGEQWIALDDRGAGAPLVCIHPIGGHSNAYTCLVDLLGGDRPIFAIRSRARLDPSREHASIAAMADDYASLIEHALPGRAVRLFGWSMGALTAHAVACALESRGRSVELVAMIDPPTGPLPESPGDLRTAVSMAIQIFHPAPPAGAALRGALRQLDPRSAAEAHRWCVERGLISAAAVSREAFDGAVGLFAIHRALASRHEPAVARAPLVVWHARGISREIRDWARHTTGRCIAKPPIGDHFSIMRPPHIEAIAAELRAFR